MVIAVVQVILVVALIQQFIGPLPNLIGPMSPFAARVAGLIAGVLLAFLNFLILNKRSDVIIARFASMPKWRQHLLDALAACVVLFSVVLFFWSLPPLPSS